MTGRVRNVCVSVACVLAVSQAAHAQTAAKVLTVQGGVEYEQPPRVPAKVNMLLSVGGTVRTGDQSRAVLLLMDETQIKINANTELKLTGVRAASTLMQRVATAASQSQESVLSVSKGQVWLRARNKPADVRVTTPAVTAAIRGTEFDLRVADDGESVITVLDGAVDFRNNLGAVLVNSGEQGRARIGEAPSKTVLVNPTDAVQWTLAYSGAVSARDYPLSYPSAAAARTAIAGGTLTGLALAAAQHDAGDLPAALQQLSTLTTAEAAELRGWILLEQGQVAAALAQLQNAPAGSPRARLGRSIAAARLHRDADARRELTTGPADALLTVQQATLDLLTGDPAAARTALEAVPSTSPAYAQSQALLSNVYLVQNRMIAARAAAERAVASHPDSPTAHLALSLVLQSEFDLSAATREAARARALDPTFEQANIQYATLLFGDGHTAEAEQVIRAVIARAPDEPLAKSALGFVLIARARNADARAAFTQALALDSALGEPHLGLGILAMREGEYDDAVTDFLEAATLEPRRSLYQTYLAKALYELRRFDQAFAALDSAKQLDPRDPSPHLYAGIFQNDLNRPGAAVQELEDSIRLNDGRAVYRSRFVLDEDRATRNVNLATAYARLGLSEWASFHAIDSEATDPANSAAHFFLASTFSNLKGRTSAEGSELLVARLLMPANANSFNAFNDYTTLFDRPRVNSSADGTVGTSELRSGDLLTTGGNNRFAFTNLLSYERTNGFHVTNDDRRERSDVGIVKIALTPRSDLMLSYQGLHYDAGDHGGGLDAIVSATDNNPQRRTGGTLNRGEVGFHAQLRPGSDLLVVARTQALNQTSNDPTVKFGYVTEEYDTGDRYTEYQAAHLLKARRLQLRYGIDMYQGRRTSVTSDRSNLDQEILDLLTGDLAEFYVKVPTVTSAASNVRYRTAFAQANYPASQHLILTGGLNYIWANNDDAFEESGRSTSGWNPNAGVIFKPVQATSLRLAVMHVTQTQLGADRLAPTQVAGFAINQNDLPLTQTNAVDAGWDQRIGRRTFVRTEGFRRNRNVPIGSLCDGLLNCTGPFYGGNVVMNRLITTRWALIPEYEVSRSQDIFGDRHDHETRLTTAFVDPTGVSASVTGDYLHQDATTYLGDSVAPRVFTVNLLVSYELPRKRGRITFSVRNAGDRRYTFIADPFALDPRIPQRTMTLFFRANF